VGVQDFIAPAGDAELAEAARTAAQVLWADLDFEKEFYLIDRQASAGIPPASAPANVPIDRWRDLGADFVVIGTASRGAAGEFTVDLQIVTVRGSTAGQVDFSSRYERCTIRNPRWCAHTIADNIHKAKRDLDGVARTKILFTSDRDNRPGATRQVKEIYVMDYDGANQRPVTAHRSLSMMPVWGADGVTMAYVSYFAGFTDIYLTRPDGRGTVRPANGSPDIRNYSPAISPDGTRLLFASSRNSAAGHFDVFIVNLDGTGLKNLTPNTPDSSESTPAWNPTGTEIAYTSDRTGVNQIWIMSPEGLGVRRVPTDKHCDRPTWSLQNFIAFAYGPQSGPHDIALYDLQSAKIMILTDGVGSNGSPAVSPNGRHVVFMTTRWGGNQLAVVSRKGGPPRRLTEAGNNSYPNWSRSPR
jgi:TolB protein